MRKIIIGRPLILFDKGKLYRRNLKKSRIDISDFLTHCRNQGYFDLSRIQTAVFEYNGSVSILPVEANRPVEPADIRLDPVQQEIPVNVILDGNINEENLKKCGMNRAWLDKQLAQQGYNSAREVYLGCVNTVESTLLIYPENTKEKDSDPFE
jgi:uncharacterized membrane protein YcaP (DUF421 family)